MKNKSISFLTTDFLGNRSYSINYHLLISIRNLLEIIDCERLTIITCSINSKSQRSFWEILTENDIEIPIERVKCEQLDYRDVAGNSIVLSAYDVVFTEMYVWYDSIYAAKTLNPNLKIVTWIHSLLRQEYICNRHSKWIGFELFVNMQEKLIDISDRVIFDSIYDKDLANRFYNCESKSVVIYPIPDSANCPTEMAGSSHGDNLRLVYAGRWEYRKGVENLIRTFFKCHSEHNMHLTILSDTNFLKNYKDLIVNPVVLRMFECLNEKGAITIMPWKNSRQDYINFLKSKADIVIIPSLYDPFNIIVYDCIMNEIPVVVSNFCGVTELINDNMMVERVNPYDPIDIVNGILKIKNRGKGIRPFIIAYNRDNAKNDLIELYKQL